MPSFPLRARWLVAGVALTAAVTAGIAYAAIPDPGGVIHSCFTKSSGAWRVIDADAGQTCKSNEAPLDLYSKGGADLAFLDTPEADARYLGRTAKAADSDKLDGLDSAAFLAADGTAADSEKLGGFPARVYVIGQGVLYNDGANLADGGTFEFGCCADVGDLTPQVDFAVSCDTAGGTTLEVSSIASFHWWWDETSGEATSVGGRYEAEFAIGGGSDRHSLRALLLNAGTTATLDLDTWISSSCLLGLTLHKSPNVSPGP